MKEYHTLYTNTFSVMTVTLSEAFLYASSHQFDVNSFARSCPIPLLSNFKLAFTGSVIPCAFFPNPSPTI